MLLSIVDGTTQRWRLHEHEQGAPIAVAYAGGDYTADAGTWTVDSGDLITYDYTVIGKRLKIDLTINSSSISSAAATRMQATIPNGYTYVKDARDPCFVFNGGTSTTGMARATAAATQLFIYRDAGAAAYAVATNTSNFFVASFQEIT